MLLNSSSIVALRVCVYVVVATIPEPSVLADSSTSLPQQQLEQAIEQYLYSHPEVIEQSLANLRTKRQESHKARIKEIIADHQNELLHDPDSPISGNPSGDVTVVEFFDYRCIYCKRVAASITKLQHDDAGVRIVYKDFPILGDVSVYAARAALAAKSQGKHEAFHEALLASANELTQAEVLSIADQVGLSRAQLESDLRSPKWDSIIERNRGLAEVLSITGTPGFIVGDQLYPGVLDLEGLKRLVEKARSK
jgi:protein-disulfide isomerase